MEDMKILWLSRHKPTEKQIEEIKKIFGDVEIIQISKTVKNADEIISLMREHNCDEIVAVLPINLIADLTRRGIKPIRAVMERIIKENNEEVEFKFKHFERIHKVEVITEKL